jgi:hypothetical protein
MDPTGAQQGKSGTRDPLGFAFPPCRHSVEILFNIMKPNKI